MIEEIISFEDFKKLLNERQLDIKNLKLDFEDKPIKDNTGNYNIFANVKAILTIPHNNNIMQCEISSRTYCIPFIKNKDDKERIELDNWLGKIKDFCKKEFGFELILGRWKFGGG